MQVDFYELIEPILKVDPIGGGDFFNCHALTGKLSGYYAMEVNYSDTAYRLVYRVYEAPAPKWVNVISFDEHDPAYEKAKARLKR